MSRTTKTAFEQRVRMRRQRKTKLIFVFPAEFSKPGSYGYLGNFWGKKKTKPKQTTKNPKHLPVAWVA